MYLGKQAITSALTTGRWKMFRAHDQLSMTEIEPLINPNSIDVSLSDHFFLEDRCTIDPYDENSIKHTEHRGVISLRPGQFVLGCVAERISCSNSIFIAGRNRTFFPCIDGKSTVGRMGISIHITAGFGDYGFDGAFTLEIKNENELSHVILRPGMRIGQIQFKEVYDPGLYEGAYSKDHNFSPVKPKMGKERLMVW